MLYVRDRRKWLRFKRWLTTLSVVATLASVGGLEGEGPVPVHSWVLLAVSGALIVNITNDFVRQYENGRK